MIADKLPKPPPPPRPSRPPPPPPRPPPPPSSAAPLNDAQHKEEERLRREKRKSAKDRSEKSQRHANRSEHVRRIVAQQQKGGGKGGSSSKPPKPGGAPPGGTKSAFQSLLNARSLGLLVDWRFRNELPRPPVGPLLAGQWSGPASVLRSHFAPRRGASDAETAHTWRLHCERDLGVPIDVSDVRWYEGRTARRHREARKRKRSGGRGKDVDDVYGDIDAGGGSDEEQDPTAASGCSAGGAAHAGDIPTLHPKDAELLEWKGGLGDSAADALKARRDKLRHVVPGTEGARSIRRSADGKIIETNGGKSTASASATLANKSASASAIAIGSVRRGGTVSGKARSRVLDEAIAPFMMRTTYVANDQYRSVHQFTSQAAVNKKRLKELNSKSKKTTEKHKDIEWVKKGFAVMAKPNMKREHPTNKKLTVVADVPFLPDIATWGHDYNHVVLDHAPRSADSSQTRAVATPAQLAAALISDVGRKEGNARMHSNLLVPADPAAAVAAAADAPRVRYDVVQQYDLDIARLAEENAPPANFCIFLNAREGGEATYHPLAARVEMRQGRPAPKDAHSRSVKRVRMRGGELGALRDKMAEVGAPLSEDEDEM